MNRLIANMTWTEKTSLIDEMVQEARHLRWDRLPAGLEAEVWEVRFGPSRAVFKIWNKQSNPDVGYQYAVLRTLRERGVSVSEPYGWGYDEANHKVLVTGFDGGPLRSASDQSLRDCARMLLDLHRLGVNDVGASLHRKYDFIPYFYPRLHEHPDIRNVLVPLVEQARLRQETMIHGDFHGGNILEDEGRYTIIDWTNAQLGDPRYDFAWAAFLIRIYVGEAAYSVFLQAYISGIDGVSEEEVEPFEAMASLRWVLLHRIADVPKYDGTLERVNHAIRSNRYLKGHYSNR